MSGVVRRVVRLIRPVLGGIGAAALVATLVLLGRLDTLEFWALSRLYELRGPQAPSAPIVIVTIDESSINEIGKWPFPRAAHGELIQKIAEGGPLAIGVDVIFEGPSPRGDDDDLVLSESVALAGNVVLGALVTVDYQGFYKREVLSLPNPTVRKGAVAVAPINLPTDTDGQVRRSLFGVPLGDEVVPAFDVELYRLAAKNGLPVQPLPKAEGVHINFRGEPRTFPWVAFYRVLRGEIPAEEFRGKIVLIGPTSEALHDVFATPFAPRGDMPGIEIHANALDTYVTGNPIRPAPRALSLAIAVVAGLFGAAVVVRLHALRGFLVTVLAWTALAAVILGLFYMANVWVQGMAGTLGLVLGYGATTLEQYIREQREKRRLSQFFSPDVLAHVVRARGSLGSHRRLVTVLFSDVRGFTTMSERLQPEQVAEILQEYLTEMTDIVFRYNGTVDKYIGDCVMALYNAPFDDPQHAANAVRTGLEFQKRTLEVSKKWEEKLNVRIRNGVGINTGEAVVGTMGSRQRLEYTAIGDTINLGARLESITKDYGASIIISETTYELVKGQFVTRELGAVTVKGKTQPVKIYAVVEEDTRRHPRAALDTSATLAVRDADGEIVVRVVNVSEGGLAVTGVPDDWKTGTALTLRCDGGGLPKPIQADATLAWRRDGSAGLAFSALAPETAAVIAEYVAARVAVR